MAAINSHLPYTLAYMGQLSNAAQSALRLAQKGGRCRGREGPGLDSCHSPL